MDNRTKAEFANDIEVGSAAELAIVQRYVHYMHRVYGIELRITDNGCGNAGQFLEGHQVSTAADYLIEGKPVEIKFNNRMLTTFRAKVSQIESYYRQGAAIIWVNGYLTKTPVFTYISKEKLMSIMLAGTETPFEGWGGKMCYTLNNADFDWYNLDELGGK